MPPPPQPSHRIIVQSLDESPAREIVGDEARHAARVKRLRVGEPVELLDGRGGVMPAKVDQITGSRAHPVLIVEPTGAIRLIEPVRPRVVVCAPPPKGARLDDMIDQLSQIGAAAWYPLLCARAETKPGSIKHEKLERRTRESMKQCGRAWVLEIDKPITLDDALSAEETIVADANGTLQQPKAQGFKSLGSSNTGSHSTSPVHLLIGPEGGWTDEERKQARASGAQLVRFGPHTMRLETACVVAAAQVIARISEPRASARAVQHDKPPI